MWRIITILTLLATAAGATPLCQVTRVVDGDTLHLRCGGVTHKVRLLGFDTPEVFHPHCADERTAGQQATTVLRELVAQGSVSAVVFKGRDRYGRDLADMRVAGRNVAEVMLTSGLARPYDGHQHPDWCEILQRSQ